MRLVRALAALAVLDGLMVSAAVTDLCTPSQMSAFTTALKTASSCLGSVTYNWGGTANPTDSQLAGICKCPSASVASIPACSVTKGPNNVTLAAHYDWVTKDECAKVPTVTPPATPTATPTVTPTATPKVTPTTASPASTPATASPASTPSSAPNSAPDLCTVVQISAFSSALQSASSCLSSTSYNWGGTVNPTSAEYSAICKCPSASAFSIPTCSVMKGPDKVPLSVHYDWVLHTQCPILFPAGTKKSSSNVGLIVGIAGVVVVVLLLVGFMVWKRKRSSRPEEFQTPGNVDYNNSGNGMRSPVGFTPMEGALQYANKSFDHRPSGASTVGTTISTANGSMIPSGNWSASGSYATGASGRSTESGKWDDPVIMAVRIPFDSIFVGALLSRGGFGEVHRGTYRGETVAIKSLLPERRKDLAQIDNFLSEVKLVSSLEHERIVKFIGVAWNSLSDVCLVVEYMENGDLRSMLGRWDSEQRPNGFDFDKVKIALHVAHALVYLHSLQPVVVHRDLKSKNVLLDANLDAKLTDFGISRERADSTMTAGVGSSLWMAPEVMMGNRYDEKADIFSFGVVLSELDTHQLPYFHAKVSESGQKLPEAAILQQVMLGRVSVGFTDRAHPDLVQLGRECVRLDPKGRPTTAQVLHRVHQVMRQFQ